jgi:hypothetical protein
LVHMVLNFAKDPYTKSLNRLQPLNPTNQAKYPAGFRDCCQQLIPTMIPPTVQRHLYYT